MKRACLFLVCTILLSLVLSLCGCQRKATDLVFENPSNEIASKIENALNTNGYEIYIELYKQIYDDTSLESLTKSLPDTYSENDVLNYKSIVNFNGNYWIDYYTNRNILSHFYISVGNYKIQCQAEHSYAIYKSDTNELISIDKAYKDSILTDKILEEFYLIQRENKDSKTKGLPFLSISKEN